MATALASADHGTDESPRAAVLRGASAEVLLGAACRRIALAATANAAGAPCDMPRIPHVGPLAALALAALTALRLADAMLALDAFRIMMLRID